MLLEINSFLYNNNHDGLHQLALAALVLRHGPSARLQGVAIFARKRERKGARVILSEKPGILAMNALIVFTVPQGHL